MTTHLKLISKDINVQVQEIKSKSHMNNIIQKTLTDFCHAFYAVLCPKIKHEMQKRLLKDMCWVFTRWKGMNVNSVMKSLLEDLAWNCIKPGNMAEPAQDLTALVAAIVTTRPP